MVKRKNDDEGQAEDVKAATAEQAAEPAEEQTGTEGQAGNSEQATDTQGVRRGLGAPPPGTDGDPTVKPV